MDAVAYQMSFDKEQLALLCANYDRCIDSLGAENKKLKTESAKLRVLAAGMYGMLEMFDKMLGNHDACETPRPLIFGEDKSFKDVMRELGAGVPDA